MTFLYIISFIIVWCGLGLIGMWLTIEFDWLRGIYPLDVTLGDLIFLLFLSVASGPIFLVVGIILTINYFVFEKYSFKKFDRVIFKAKRKWRSK